MESRDPKKTERKDYERPEVLASYTKEELEAILPEVEAWLA